MDSNDDKATVAGGVKNLRVEVKRVVNAPIARVWSAITRADEVRQWWAAGEVEAREGGRIKLEGGDDCGPDALPLDGRVKVFLPPHVFEFTWNEASDPAMGLVRFDLVELDEHTTLVTLVNTVPAGDLIAAAIGWHVLMDRLRDQAVRGEVGPAPDEARMQELHALYAGSD